MVKQYFSCSPFNEKLFDYIYNEPHRVLLMLGIDLETFQHLTTKGEKSHNAH